MSKMIRVSPGFQYSVNIHYDMDNPQKIASYIPTEKTIMLLDELINDILDDFSNQKAKMIIGPYGTGKSHFFSVFGALIKGFLPKEAFNPLLDKIIASGSNDLASSILNVIKEKPYLTVVINDNGRATG